MPFLGASRDGHQEQRTFSNDAHFIAPSAVTSAAGDRNSSG